MYQYDLLAYIGRFQPYHLGHDMVIKEALKISERLVILVGSSNQPRTPKNPWTFEERRQMILESLPQECRNRISIEPLRDRIYNEEQWLSDVQQIVHKHRHGATRIGLIGYTKDDSSYYLKKFPQWIYVEAAVKETINATDLRHAYFKTKFMSAAQLYLPTNVLRYLEDFSKSEHFDYVVEEQKFLDAHSKVWAFAPYQVTFNTADSVVIQSGHILLVRRKYAPGKGLWALPGGYLSGDTFEDAALRELSEESTIKLQEIVLRRSIKEAKVFDHPDRSLRGRIITVAHLIHLEQIGEGLPKVKGSDDAAEAKWFPISQFHNMEHVMFEDHFHIAVDMIGRCK